MSTQKVEMSSAKIRIVLNGIRHTMIGFVWNETLCVFQFKKKNQNWSDWLLSNFVSYPKCCILRKIATEKGTENKRISTHVRFEFSSVFYWIIIL